MQSFEDVAKLETPALRELFATGRPEQRVWAIWALALRTGGLVAVGGAARDPDPGVRRTTAVMLAGHGEIEMLVELARRDPSTLVRVSAMQIVTRFAAQGAIDHAVVLEAARVDPPVRGAILAGLDRGAPPVLVELAMDSLRYGDLAEQGDAFEALMRIETTETVSAALAWLADLPDGRVRDACVRLVRVVGEYPFACEMARASVRLRRIALSVLHRPAWPAVEQLIGDDVDLLVEIARAGKIDVPATVLAKAALDGHATPLVERLGADLAILDAPSDELRPLLPLLDAHYEQWITALDGREEEPEEAGLAYAKARDDARKQLVRLRKQVQRLMRAG